MRRCLRSWPCSVASTFRSSGPTGPVPGESRRAGLCLRSAARRRSRWSAASVSCRHSAAVRSWVRMMALTPRYGGGRHGGGHRTGGEGGTGGGAAGRVRASADWAGRGGGGC